MDDRNLTLVATEIDVYISTLQEQGYSPTDIRKYVILSLDKTVIMAFMDIRDQVLASAEAGFNFVYSAYKIFGGVNAILVREGLDPVHLSEIDFLQKTLIPAMVDYAEAPIDEIMERMEQAEKEGKNGQDS